MRGWRAAIGAAVLVFSAPAALLGQTAAAWQADVDTLMARIRAVHPDPFANTSGAAFDSAAAALRGRMPALSPAERLVGLARLMALLEAGNGHSRIRMSPVLDRSLPLRFYRFAEGTFVVAAAPEHGDLAGARLVAVGGVAVDTVYAILEDVVAADNDATRWQRVPLLYSVPAVLAGSGVIAPGDAVDGVAMTFEVNGRSLERRIRSVPHDGSWIDDWEDFAPWYTDEPWVFANAGAGAPVPTYLEHTELPRFRIERLHDGATLWAQINGIHDGEDETLAAFARRLLETARREEPRRIVIDIRHNGGGNGLLTRELIRQLSASEWDRPDRLFALIGRTTYSAAGFLAAELDYWTEATFVGEPTGARPNGWGDAPRFTLPGTGTVISIAGLYWQKGLAFDTQEWIAPDLHVPPTFAAFSANQDPALEAVTGPDRRFETTLLEIAPAGSEAVLAFMTGAGERPLYAYISPVQATFQLANQRLDAGDTDTALPLFQALTGPAAQYAIIWERLGDTHAAAGDVSAAAAAYSSALERDPDSERIRDKLEDLRP